MFPWLLLGLPAGAWADRVARRPLMVACDLTAAVLIASVPVAAWLGVLTMAQLLAVALLAGGANVLFTTAYRAYLPDTAARRRERAPARQRVRGADRGAGAGRRAGPGARRGVRPARGRGDVRGRPGVPAADPGARTTRRHGPLAARGDRHRTAVDAGRSPPAGAGGLRVPDQPGADRVPGAAGPLPRR
ncbi:MFS transporter [Amycolatopsis acidiphila]|uniref:MFS transporter n=1 Tax=Amycolatopsis acidiphila TaxID=715473 RepID=UPI00164376B3